MIRKATYEDLKIINDLGENLFSNFKSSYSMKDYINNNNYIVLVNENIIVNSFLLAYNNIDYFELEAIYVDKKYRNCKIATRLLQRFILEYCKQGNRILLEVNENNIPAINFYNKNGFIIINKRKKYYKNDDALIMEKVIK